MSEAAVRARPSETSPRGHRPADPLPPASSQSRTRGRKNLQLYLTGQTVGAVGNSISQIATPVLAVVQLDATTAQVALLALLGQLPQALLALHAGAWADRRSKRRQMIIGDVVSALVLITVPLAAVLGALTLTQLMAVAIVQGAASALYDAAATSYLPALVDRSLIQQNTSRVGALLAVATTVGSNLGAALTGALGPARAVSADVLSHLISAWCTARIKAPDAPPPPSPGGRLLSEIGEGLRYVYVNSTLRTLTLMNSALVFGLAVISTLWVLYLVRTLAMSTTAVGVLMGVGALGAAAGALLAPRLSVRHGPGPTMLVALALTPLTQIPLLLAAPGRMWQIAIGAALFLQMVCTNAVGATQRSIRQYVTAADKQARMQAVNTCMTTGSRPLASFLAGALGTWIGVRNPLAVGTCLLVVPFVVLYCSPLRTLRQMPGPSPFPDT
ncbi:MFS transporter [Streptomyces sp. NPDC002917]|uniref:MFS transporter n=1 Tax=Streptomyces sp. NPDC002917 TaxID=3364671 RepID=UPI0036C47C3D